MASLKTRARAWHCVIHNQGEYDPTGLKKDRIAAMFPDSLYCIAQEMYPENLDDSHLQFNVFFTNARTKSKILKVLQTEYKETATDAGLVGRVQVMPISGSWNRVDNYLKMKDKVGGDPNVLTNITNGHNMVDWDEEIAKLIDKIALLRAERDESLALEEFNDELT